MLCDEGAAAVSPAAVELVLPPLGRLVTTASTRLLTDLAEHDAAAAVAAVTSESHLKAFNVRRKKQLGDNINAAGAIYNNYMLLE